MDFSKKSLMICMVDEHKELVDLLSNYSFNKNQSLAEKKRVIVFEYAILAKLSRLAILFLGYIFKDLSLEEDVELSSQEFVDSFIARGLISASERQMAEIVVFIGFASNCYTRDTETPEESTVSVEFELQTEIFVLMHSQSMSDFFKRFIERFQSCTDKEQTKSGREKIKETTLH